MAPSSRLRRRLLRLRAAAPLLATCLALAGVANLALPTQADAAPRVQYGLTDDAWLLNGPGTLTARIASLHTLGVPVVRFTLEWDTIAQSRPTVPSDPTDAAYDWSADDQVLDALHAAHIGVLLQLLGTPRWANGGLPPNYAPTSGATFAAFAKAAARHYPWVKRWLIWNEPNQVRWLRPTKASIYTTRLLNPAYAAIHSTTAGAQVGGGMTAPRGATEGVSPITWIAGMHAAHARLDAYAHNPYPLNPKLESPLAGGCGHCQTITMATIGRLVRLVSRDFGRARIWLTEYGYQTNPPDKFLGVSAAAQARYVAEGLYQAYRTPRVDLLIQYLYRDEPDIARFQSGFVRLNNARKPAYSAFQLPLAELSRSGSTTTLWGALRAPGAGTVARIERRAGTGWQTVASVRAGIGHYFRWRGTLARGSTVRVDAGAVVGAAITIR